MNIGEKIKQIRISKNLKQSELAEKSGLSRVAIGNYERGDRNPHIETLNKIAIALNVDLNDLLELNIVLSQKIISYLERSMLKTVDYENISKTLSENLGIDYKLLNDCISEDNELPLDVQEKLLVYLSDIDYPLFLEFIERYKNEIQKLDELNKSISEIFVMKIHDLDNESIKLLKSYILLVFGKDTLEILKEDTLYKLQEEVTKFLEFKLYEIEKEYYGEEKEDD